MPTMDLIIAAIAGLVPVVKAEKLILLESVSLGTGLVERLKKWKTFEIVVIQKYILEIRKSQ